MRDLCALLRRALVACALAALATSAWAQAGGTSARLQLLSHLPVESRVVPLSEGDWAWLRDKRTLLLGVPAPGLPPVDVVFEGGFEGITADVTALLQQQLGIDIAVRYYPDRAQAIRALEDGSIDLLASANSFEGDMQPLALSRPYANDQPSLFRRQGDARGQPDDLDGVTVAIPQDYLPGAALQQRYPRARFVRYRSNAQAMAALAFGQADAYLGDTLSASLLLNQSFFGFVRFERFLPLASDGFGFAMRRDGTPLPHIIDTALASLGQNKLDRIAKRWASENLMLPDERLDLDAQERRWIARHPVVKLTINDDSAPIAFFDAAGNFNGIAADLLQRITQRTGLRFEVQRTGSFGNLQQDVVSGKADLAMLVPSPEREDKLRFTRPFLSSYFVLVARKGAPVTPQDLQQAPAKRAAIARGHAAISRIGTEYPLAQVVTPSTALDALRMVEDGEADVAVASLTTARYYIARLHGDKLAVSGMIGNNSVPLGFAMRRGDTELQSILNKAIQASSPLELRAIVNRWRSNAAMTGQTWRDYRQTIGLIIGAAVALLALFAAWIFHLRRQIRQRMRAERALGDQLQFMRTFTDGLPDPVYVRDGEGRMLSCNRRYQELLGIHADQALGKTACELPPELFKSAPAFHDCYLRALADGKPMRHQQQVKIRGEARWIDHWVQPFSDASGKTKGVICGWRDITDERRLIEELQQAKNLADQASRAKTTFLATMSHEIRTPMNAVIGTLELALRRAEAGVFEHAAIETAYASANSLLALIGDILDIVRIESGHLSLAPTRAGLRELAESVTRVFDGPARQKGLALTLELDSSVNVDVLVDPMRFKQILSNLVSNAIKFTARGFVRIRLGCAPVGNDQVEVSLSVQDSGAGIAAADQPQLFRPFSQGREGQQAGQGGTGLGLAICRSLCEMMGGTLALHSTEGVGTQVDVTLRLNLMPAEHAHRNADDPASASASAAPAADGATLPAPTRQLQVLVVDDHPVNRLLLCQQVDFLGHRAAAAEDGARALQRWRDEAFDVIVTDRHMPAMNGEELARAIRREEARRGLAPCLILGLTADARKEAIADCLAAGMNDCLIKPVGLDALQTLLATAAHAMPVATPVPAPAGESAEEVALSALMQLADGSPAVARRLIDTMLHANAEDRLVLERNIQMQDAAALASCAHRIKGAAQMLKAGTLTQACAQLQALGQDPGTPAARLREAVEAVTAALATLDDTLRRHRATLPAAESG